MTTPTPPHTLRRYHTDLLETQKRLRALAATSHLPTPLEPDPPPPHTPDDLAKALRTIRRNIRTVELDLLHLDHKTNGPETRTRQHIQQDITKDQHLLTQPFPLNTKRTRGTVERNITYDRFQLTRNKP